MEPTVIRVGQGFDVHRFAENRPLILGGVRIAERGGLDGHSDADAVLHALTDAIFGAIGAGDIGSHFPSDDSQWKDASSRIFVERSIGRLREARGRFCNADITVIAQHPRLAPHREAMKSSIAAILGVPAENINVKATTTDHLGFTGRGEGICAMAVVLVEIPERDS